MLFVCLVSAPGAGAGAAEDVVRVAFQPFQSYGGLFIADREGYFAAQRIKVGWVTLSGGQSVPLLLQGDIYVGAGGLSPALLNAVARGQKVRVVADKGHVGPRGTSGAIVVRRDLAGVVRSVADLKGRKFVIPGPGGLGHYVLARALAAQGLSLDDVTAVTMPAPVAIAAMLGGSVDAVFLGPPQDAQAVDAGAGFRLIDIADIMPGEPVAFLFYGPTLLEQQRDLGTRFMVAYLRGLKRYNDGPTPRNVAIIAEYTKIDPDVVRKSGWSAIHADGFVDIAKLRRFQDWLYEIGLLDVRNPMNQVVDTSFLDHAKTVLGPAGR